MAMKNNFFLIALSAALFAGCGEAAEPNDNADASDTDADTDSDADGGQGDCGEPWGWYDETSGLCWDQPPGDTEMTWYDAQAYCDARDSGGHLDWRLPSISELRSVIRGCPEIMTGGPCGVTDECNLDYECNSDSCKPLCDNDGPGPGHDGCFWDSEIVGECDPGVGCVWFWSSTGQGDSYLMWSINLVEGYIDFVEADALAGLPWCVRSGP